MFNLSTHDTAYLLLHTLHCLLTAKGTDTRCHSATAVDGNRWLVTLVLSATRSPPTRTPSNVATKAGLPVTLACGGDNLAWVFINSTGFRPITWQFKSGSVLNVTRYQLTVLPAGYYDLTIFSTNIRDAGKYECVHTLTDRVGAEVIVFGKAYFQFYLNSTLCICCTSNYYHMTQRECMSYQHHSGLSVVY